jgi:RHS repeat-associated protein
MNHLKTGNTYFAQGSYKSYKFGEKELQEFGAYDFGARMYMADIGRWFAADPMAEANPGLSVYRYGFNNPVMFTDPNGMLEDAVLEKIWNIGGEWKNNGNGGFDYGKHTVDFDGSYSFNTDDVIGEKNLPLLDLGSRKTSFFWGNLIQMHYNVFIHGSGRYILSNPIGTQVLEAKTSFLGRLLATVNPREWSDDYMTYVVNADGKIARVQPIGGAGPLEYISGAGELKYLLANKTALKTFKSTEIGAQEIKKVKEMAESMRNGDMMKIYGEKIVIYYKDGERYILDGHHRIQAAIQENKTLEIIEVSGQKALQMFGDKVKQINAGLFK